MTIATDSDLDVQTDGHIDRRVDDGKDTQPVADGAASAFVIVLANHKGGVTKTTSTANLGATFAEAGQRVLIVDDLLATGGTIAATLRLLKKLGADVVGTAVLIELAGLNGRAALDGVEVTSFITY